MKNIENNMKKLSKILKDRGGTDFKTELRNKLLRKANEMNVAPAPATKPKREWRMPRMFKIAFAPVTAGALLVAIMFYALSPSGVLFDSSLRLVDVAAAEDYYVLTAIDEGTDGVDGASAFLLESKEAIDASEIEEAVAITPYTDLEIIQESETSVKLIPYTDLESGAVYKVSLDATLIEDSPYPMEYSWAYQISDQFAIRGSYPADESNVVDPDTGIELEFNSYGVEASDFESHFNIYPYTDGSFEVQGKTGIFIPSSLEEGVIYTVTIDANMPLAGSGQALTEDYVFQFETTADSPDGGSISIHKDLFEFSTSDIPTFGLSYYGWEEEVKTVDVALYKYSNGDDYITDISVKNANAPSWSRYSSKYYRTLKDNMSLVMESPETELTESYYTSNLLVLPEALDQGYYLLEVSKGELVDQVFLQISDLSAYIFAGEESGLVWLNDVSTSQPISGATVEILDTDYSYTTDGDGIANFDLPKSNDGQYSFLKVTYDDYEAYYSFGFSDEDEASQDDYWSFLTTERTTYHPTDKVYFWGYIEGRNFDVSDDLNLIVADYAWASNMEYIEKHGSIYYEESFSVSDGEVFDGYIDLEKYHSGDYALYLFEGDSLIDKAQFSVEYFVKPAYEINIETGETYLLSGETTSVDISAEFFEGTPVSNLSIKYSPPTGDDAYYETDSQGQLSLEHTAVSDNCSETYCPLIDSQYINIYPLYEEEADISGQAKISVLASSVGIPSVEADHNLVSFEAMNIDIDAVRSYDGYIGIYTDEIYSSVAASAQIDLDVKEYVTSKEENGTYYDYIEKSVKTKYSYSYDYEDVASYTIYTDENGEASQEFSLDPDSRYIVYYTVYDEDGNYYKASRWINAESTSTSSSNYNYGDNKYATLSNDSDDSNFSIGESIDLEVVYNVADTAEEEDFQFLFMELQRGLQDYEVSSDPYYSSEFDKSMIPNITYQAIMFDGKYYLPSSYSYAYYDYDEDQRLDIEIDTDSTEYGPSDEATLSFDVTNSDTGNAVSGSLNVFMVDEAYYAIYADQIPDPLDELYDSVSAGIQYSYSSHNYPSHDTGGKGGCFVAGTQILMADGTTKNIEDIEFGDTISTRFSEFDDDLVVGEVTGTYEHYVDEYMLVNNMLGVTNEHVMFINGKWALSAELNVGDVLINSDGQKVMVETIEYMNEPVYVYNFEVKDFHTYFANGIYVHNDKGGVRSELKDTALFEVIELDANGQGSVTFELPDNITSWRIVASAISDDREAGFATANLDVSKPVFVLPVLNSEYLSADQPVIPVRAYGDYLTAGMQLTIGIESESLGIAEEQTGEAYEVSYFELSNLTEGEHAITTYAEVDDEGDALMLTTTVLDSHLRSQDAWSSVLKENTDLIGSEDSRTEVSFMNYEVGIFYSELIAAARSTGDRADEVAAKTVAHEVLNEYFDYDFSPYEFDNFLYQNDDGGIGLFPNDDSRLELSAKLTSLDSELWDQVSLSGYFQDILEGDDYILSEKILALYGLASLGDNVLLDLNYLVSEYELSDEDKIYAALAYVEFGSKGSAINLYLTIDDEDAYPALMAALAAQLGSTDHYDFFSSISEEIYDLETVEKIIYAKSLLEYGVDATVTFSLNGDMITLEKADLHTESMLPEELAAASFSEISGDIMVITKFEEDLDLTEVETFPEISITRTYFVDGHAVESFEIGELVRVHIQASIPTYMAGSYRVTDYLPSGLKITSQATNEQQDTDSSIKSPYNIDGQSASFYVYQRSETSSHITSFSYYARVINTGSFVTEPAVLQSMSDLDVINLSGGLGSVTIE